VGLNKFAMPEETEAEEEFFEVDERVEEIQKGKLSAMKAGRKEGEVKQALKALELGIDQDENLMPKIVEAVKCYATIGEICGVMRGKWGEFRAPTYV